jgi:hypothetical protein
VIWIRSGEGHVGLSLTLGHRLDETPGAAPPWSFRRLVQFSGLSWPPCEPECCPSLDHLSRFHTSSHYTGHKHMHMKYTYIYNIHIDALAMAYYR